MKKSGVLIIPSNKNGDTLLNVLSVVFDKETKKKHKFPDIKKITFLETDDANESDPKIKLNEEYFGKEICIDQEIASEWSRIPHFYTPFYVYQYATGYSAAIAISRRLLSPDPKERAAAREGYFRFLGGGSSMNPIDLLKLTGTDMTSKEPVESALELFGRLLDQMEALLEDL